MRCAGLDPVDVEVALCEQPADRRKLLIEVTLEGRRIVSELMGIRHEWLAAAIERDLTLAEPETLAIAAGLMQPIASSHVGGVLR